MNGGGWMLDFGFWIEKDKKTQKTQRDDGGFFTLINKEAVILMSEAKKYLKHYC